MRDGDERHVALIQMRHNAVKIVGPKRAAFAAGLPIGTKHEMVDDKLTAAAEQLPKCLLPFGALEYILLGDAHPRQIPARLAQLIAQTREFLLLGENLLARLYPCFWRYDLMIGHAHFSSRDLTARFRPRAGVDAAGLACLGLRALAEFSRSISSSETASRSN